MSSSTSLLRSSAVRFYLAQSITSDRVCLQGVRRPRNETSPLSRFRMPFFYRHSPLLLLDQPTAHNKTSEISLSCLVDTHLKYPPAKQSWHVHVDARHQSGCLAPKISHTFHFSSMHWYSHRMFMHPSADLTAFLHMWHGSAKSAEQDDSEGQLANHKPAVAVVLLGWLGAEHRHLKRYADWYTSREFPAITFVIPMRDLVTLKAGEKAEKHIDVLTDVLVRWLKEEPEVHQDGGRTLIFHTFSNTGWLTYGAVLERLLRQGDGLLKRINGCIVDSAPSPRPDPHVWALGFSAALLKKGSVATQTLSCSSVDAFNGVSILPKLGFKETVLLAMLENVFAMFLQIPYVKRRLNEVGSVLANQQPPCPQLYIYSSADTVIPAKSVESFIEEQKKVGRIVKSCDFQCSPHVDHFRTFPEKYSGQLTSFLKLCMPQWAP